jgi:hypothetical protein
MASEFTVIRGIFGRSYLRPNDIAHPRSTVPDLATTQYILPGLVLSAEVLTSCLDPLTILLPHDGCLRCLHPLLPAAAPNKYHSVVGARRISVVSFTSQVDLTIHVTSI